MRPVQIKLEEMRQQLDSVMADNEALRDSVRQVLQNDKKDQAEFRIGNGSERNLGLTFHLGLFENIQTKSGDLDVYSNTKYYRGNIRSIILFKNKFYFSVKVCVSLLKAPSATIMEDICATCVGYTQVGELQVGQVCLEGCRTRSGGRRLLCLEIRLSVAAKLAPLVLKPQLYTRVKNVRVKLPLIRCTNGIGPIWSLQNRDRGRGRTAMESLSTKYGIFCDTL